MIKAVIFDLSDVCFNAEEPPFIKAFAEKHGLDFSEFEKRYLELLHKAENHEISGREIWSTLLTHYGIEVDPSSRTFADSVHYGASIDKIIAEMMADKVAYQPTLDLVKKLRSTVKTAFFTNYNEDYWKYIDKKFKLSNYFDIGLVSYMIGARKPAVRGFEYLLEKLGVKPEEAIFTDDSAKNLENAKQLGIHTIQFQNVLQLTLDLQALGVSVE